MHSLDISRQLNDYAVEYAVLREEMPRMATLTDENRHLAADNARMSSELDVSIGTKSLAMALSTVLIKPNTVVPGLPAGIEIR